MSGRDVEHVSCFLNGNSRQPPSFPDTDDLYHDASSNIKASLIASSSSPDPSLASTTYTEQPRLTSTQAFRAPTGLSSSGSPDIYGPDGRTSPDPDDFYRPHQSLLAANDGTEADSGTGLMVGVNNNGNAENRPIVSQRVYSVPTRSPELTSVSRAQYRSTSDSSYRGFGSDSTKGSSARTSTARSRQTSFKDLINKFNNNVDQVLPLPVTSTPISREPSRAASPASPIDHQLRSRSSSRPCDTSGSLENRKDVSGLNTATAPGQYSFDLTVPQLRNQSNWSSSSSTYLNPSDSLPHRALIRELLSVDTGFQDSGYGLPSHMRRRGSEGSIPSPNPAFLDHHDLSPGFSPLTPTAWYLGHTPSLEAVNTGANPSSHRRVKSDFSGNWPGGASAQPSDSHMAVPAPLQPNSRTSLESPHSKSRIPVSSRRLNSASGSEVSSPTATVDPTFGNRPTAQIPLPPRGISRLPKPSPKSPRDISDDSQIALALSPRGRREMVQNRPRHQRSGKGALLEAYIAAPPPKKSPPLRSSRPRQPVSHTAPTSRSKVVETVSNFQSQINRDRESRNFRQRGLQVPELGHVDFATRRQRIQQAFNRTIQENERKEEKAAELRRQVKHREDKQEPPRVPSPQVPLPERPQSHSSPQPEDTATVIEESVETCHEEEPSVSSTGHIRATPHLHVDTDIRMQEPEGRPIEEAHPMTVDSPTLGHSTLTLNGEGMNTKSSGPPTSAMTSGSNETHVTAFDPEPQAGLSRQNVHASHRTLLSQIMQIRESSPSGSSCDEPDLSFSENDDRESIPIMLRDALGLEDSMDSSDNQESCDLYIKQAHTTGEPPHRWSMSSWSSSLRNQHFTDDQCEDSGDDLSQIQHSADDGEIATTRSCSAASSTPPSVTGRQPPSTLNHNNSTTPESKHENGPNRNIQGHSNAPNLARLGGWNSRLVTQLYFKELARGRGHNLPMPAIRASPEPHSSDISKRNVTEEPGLVSQTNDFPSEERIGHTASLVLPGDWEHASPSIMDWMRIAADDGTAPKDQADDSSKHDGAPTPRIVTPSIQAAYPGEATHKIVGVAVDVQSSLKADSRDSRPSPLEQSQQPPPPVGSEEINASRQPFHSSSAGNLSQPLLGAFVNTTFAPLGSVQSNGSSGDSSLRRLDPTHSPQALDSSTTSLVPSTSEQPHPGKASPSPEQRRLKKRRHVIKELVDTEYTFGRDMKVVDDIYKGTSSSCLDLSSEDVKILFANSDQVVRFSMSFQDALKEAAKSVYVMPKSQRWSSKRARNSHASKVDPDTSVATGISELENDNATFIGQAFMTNMAYMEKIYADYLKNHDAANKKLQTLQRNPKVAIWLKECREWASDLTTAWDLDSLLVKPVQRILKYPLLLTELLDSTPSDHPDRASLVSALEEVTNISIRINEMKKRADLVGQVVGRKRKESDVRAGLSKAFGRRTEKLRQQVGLSDMVEDKDYDALSQRFGDNFFQLQVVMRDAETYTREAQSSMERFGEFVAAIEGFIDVSQTNYSELEGKWRELKICAHEIMTATFPDHLSVVRKNVIEPMVTLLKLHEGPQKVMKKRDKRLMDYARFKTIKDKGDKPDKKTTEQGEQFVALNETLKDELPKLYSLTAKLMEACLKNFIQIQTSWFKLLQEKLAPLVDSFPDDIQKIVGDWSATFTFSEAQLLSLGICNGSLLADAVNLVNFNTPSTGATISSPRRSSTVNSASTRVGSTMEEPSPKVSYDFGNGNALPFRSPSIDGQSQLSSGRLRADSSLSDRGAEAPEIPRSQMLQQITGTSSGSVPPTSVPQTESIPSLPRLSLDSPFLVDVMGPSGSEAKNDEDQPTTPGGRYSGFFSSAMPMSDNPQDEGAPAENDAPKEPTVLFLAASIYEFNIDRARREAGYPYLTYVAGEIFDVIAEKGELWLAKNQDDPTRQVGWIWNKHFAKLSN